MADLEQLSVRGWEVLRLSSEQLTLDLVPALGGTMTRLARRIDGAELLWATPWGLRSRGSLSVPGSSEALRFDSSPGGWQTLFPNGGDSASVHGAEWGYDGEARVTSLDWTFTGGSLVFTGRLVRSPFEISKTVSLRRLEVTIGETVRNVGRERVEVMWGNHLQFGGDLLGPDSVLEAAAAIVHPDPQTSYNAGYDDLMPWPRSYGREAVINLRTLPTLDAGETRLAYLTDFSTGSMTLSRPARDLAVDLDWDLAAWPHVWYRLEAGGQRGYPWFGAGYFLALTPSTSWPAHGLHEARRVSDSTVWIGQGEARTASITLRVRPAATGRT